MAIYSNPKHQQIDALKENLIAVNFCLTYEKFNNNDWGEDRGCLGIPALILLCSIIDTIGSFFRGGELEIGFEDRNRKIEKAKHHFYILNHERLFDLKLKKFTITDFYSTYRSKLTHNNSLPRNNFLKSDKNDNEVFELDGNDKIVCVNLYSLYLKTKSAADEFSYWLTIGTFSSDHRLTIELESQSRNEAPALGYDDDVTGTQTSFSLDNSGLKKILKTMKKNRLP